MFRTRSSLATCVMVAICCSAFAQETSTSKEVAPQQVMDQLTGAVDPFDEGFTRQGFLRAAGKEMELDREEFTAAKKLLLEGKEARPWLRPFDAWPGLAKFDQKNEKGEKSNTIDWVEFKEYRHQVFHALLGYHDQNKDCKLVGSERDEANRALAANKLMAYLDAVCCGESTIKIDGEKIHVPSDPVEREKFIEQLKARAGVPDFAPTIDKSKKLFAIRKVLALQDVRMMEGFSEAELMPYTDELTEDQLSEILAPFHDDPLVAQLPKVDWDMYVHILHRRLLWELAGDPDGIRVSGDVLHQYRFGQNLPADRLPERTIEKLWYLYAPVHRLGFAHKTIVAEQRNPRDFFTPESWAGLSPEQRKRFEDEHLILTLRAVARQTPSLVFSGASKYANDPDGYVRLELNLLYDPRNPHGRFYPVKSLKLPVDSDAGVLRYVNDMNARAVPIANAFEKGNPP